MASRNPLHWVAGEKTPSIVAITRVFNFGTWEEWIHMRRDVPRREIERALTDPLRGQWTPRGKAFAEAVFERTLPDDVLLSYDA